MASFNKVDAYIYELTAGTHLWGTDTFKLVATNTAPNASTTTWSLGSFPAPAAANGYTSGGYTLSITKTDSGGTTKLLATDVVITATAGGIGPFRYLMIINTSKSNKVVGYYDYASSVTLADTETFTVDFDGSTGFLQHT